MASRCHTRVFKKQNTKLISNKNSFSVKPLLGLAINNKHIQRDKGGQILMSMCKANNLILWGHGGSIVGL